MNFHTPSSRRIEPRALIVRTRDGAVLAKFADPAYAATRLDCYGDAGTVELRECTAEEAREVESGARPGSMRRAC